VHRDGRAQSAQTSRRSRTRSPGVDDDAAALVEREAELGQDRVRRDTVRPDERLGLEAAAVGERHVAGAGLLERRSAV
jgi:hypothetical protein